MNHNPITKLRIAIVHFVGMKTREEIEEEHTRDSQKVLSVTLGVRKATSKVHEVRRHLSRQPSVSEIVL